MIVSITCAAVLLRARVALVCGVGVLILALLVDGSLGFPLAAKFARLWDDEFSGMRQERLTLWLAAWDRFLEAPWLGQGSYTFSYTYADGITVR